MHSNSLEIVSLFPEDIPQVSTLTPEGWDDLTAPFQRYIEYPFCKPYKAMLGERAVGLGTVIYYTDVAWLAAITVHHEYRNKGIGLAITKALVDSVDSARYKTILLDATEFGYPVYKKAGFEAFSEHLHYSGSLLIAEQHRDIVPFHAQYLPQVLTLDKLATGDDRSELLAYHLHNAVLFISGGEVQGFSMPSFSKGVVIASNPEAGKVLMRCRLQHHDFCMFPAENIVATDFAESCGLKYTGITRRMRLGAARNWQPDFIYNVINGGYG